MENDRAYTIGVVLLGTVPTAIVVILLCGAAGGSCRRRTSKRLAAGASQVPASQNSAPVISLAPAKFLLKGLQFRLDLIKMTVALNRALGII
jgi:hypothetical protein